MLCEAVERTQRAGAVRRIARRALEESLFESVDVLGSTRCTWSQRQQPSAGASRRHFVLRSWLWSGL
jgi:hypothetical protein